MGYPGFGLRVCFCSRDLVYGNLEKKELIENIHNQGDAAERLLDQINRRYSEALLIHEIGQAASMMQEVLQWLDYVMESWSSGWISTGG